MAKHQLPLGEGTDYHARQAWWSPRCLFASCTGPKRERPAPRTTGEQAMLLDSAMMLAQGVGADLPVDAPTVSPIIIVIYLVVVAVGIAGMWKTFTKAGQPGWACIVPIYNLFVLVEISGRPILWFFLMLIPCVNVVIAIIVLIDVAARFGKSAGFGVGLFFLGFIFFPILGFGDAQYQGGGTRY
jgi:hypothetical protein